MISTVIPAHNAAATIREALASILREGIPGMEVIVVDDGSTDDTTTVVESAMQRSGDWDEALRGMVRCSADEGQMDERGAIARASGAPGTRIIQIPVNRGPAAARNRGLAEAKGEWIAFLDADDVWLPGKLALQLAMAGRDPGVAMWCGGVCGKRVPASEVRCDGSVPSRAITLEMLAMSNPVATSTVLVRRSVLREVGGFDERFRGPEDYELWIRIAARHSIRLIDATLAYHRPRPGSLSRDDRRFLPEVLRVLEMAFGSGGALEGLRRLRGRALAEQYFSAAWMAWERSDRGRAAGLLVRSLAMHPGRLAKEEGDRWLRLKLLGKCLCRPHPATERNV